jgi:hypothetical protein
MYWDSIVDDHDVFSFHLDYRLSMHTVWYSQRNQSSKNYLEHSTMTYRTKLNKAFSITICGRCCCCLGSFVFRMNSTWKGSSMADGQRIRSWHPWRMTYENICVHSCSIDTTRNKFIFLLFESWTMSSWPVDGTNFSWTNCCLTVSISLTWTMSNIDRKHSSL